MDKLPELVSANEAQAKKIADLESANAQAKADLETVKASLATVTAERDAFKASQADFDKRVAAEVAKAGIIPTPVAKTVPGPKADDPSKLTGLARAIAAEKALTSNPQR